MEIYVVQFGDDIESIANRYGISVERLISDNGLTNPNKLAVGQTLVILYPKEIYTIKPGDTLEAIAEQNGISLMQLIRNNPFLYDREYLYQDETLVISYNTISEIQTNGYIDTAVSQDILSKVLPYLTYISIYDYRIVDDNFGLISDFDDTTIIKMAKQYDTIPLLAISALSPSGEINTEFLYELLLDNELQEKLINEVLHILRYKGYMGANLIISNITHYNQSIYLNIIEKISAILRNEGYIFKITITSNDYTDLNLNYNSISLFVDRIIFLENIWIKRIQPPAPVSNISLIRPFIENIISNVSPELISFGEPLIGIDWIIPHKPGSTANLMSLNSVINLAYEQKAVIQFDEVSQTPYVYYDKTSEGGNEQHIVWFIDARRIKASDDVILDYDLVATNFWNLRSYYQPIFSIIAATFNIIKLPIQ